MQYIIPKGTKKHIRIYSQSLGSLFCPKDHNEFTFQNFCNLSKSGSTFLFSSFSNERCELTCADTYKMIGMHYALPGLVYAVHTMHKQISDKAKKSRVHLYQVSDSGKQLLTMIILIQLLLVSIYIPIIGSNCRFNCSIWQVTLVTIECCFKVILTFHCSASTVFIAHLNSFSSRQIQTILEKKILKKNTFFKGTCINTRALLITIDYIGLAQAW